MTQTPHKPTKRKPLKDAKASEAQIRAPKSREEQPSKPKVARPSRTLRGKHARVESVPVDKHARAESAPPKKPLVGKSQAGAADEACTAAEKMPRKGFSRGKKIFLGIGIAVLAIAIAVVIVMFNAHDDTQDIQGQWQIQGTEAIITITDKQIVLTDDVAYDYHMDPWTRTLDVGFFGASGSAQYAFNSDRTELVITESFVNDDGETVENALTLVKPGAAQDDANNAPNA